MHSLHFLLNQVLTLVHFVLEVQEVVDTAVVVWVAEGGSVVAAVD